jgi:hypothetical protein
MKMIGEPRVVRGVVVRLLTAGLFAAVGSGCGDDSCPDDYGCTPADGGGGQGNGGGGPGGGGEGGEGGGISADCAPTEGVAVGASCGVFVQAGATGGDGSQASPYGSLVEALQNEPSAARVYVCGGDTFEGSVEVSGRHVAVRRFCVRGLDVQRRGGARPLILGDADVPAMRITGTGSSRVMSLDLEAPSAEAAGASSLGLLVSEATVELEAVAITAGDGAAGAAPPAQVEQLARAQGGMTGAVAGTVPVNAMGGANTCGLVALSGGALAARADRSQAALQAMVRRATSRTPVVAVWVAQDKVEARSAVPSGLGLAVVNWVGQELTATLAPARPRSVSPTRTGSQRRTANPARRAPTDIAAAAAGARGRARRATEPAGAAAAQEGAAGRPGRRGAEAAAAWASCRSTPR